MDENKKDKWLILEILGRREIGCRLLLGEPPYDHGVHVAVELPDGTVLPEYYARAALFAVREVPEEMARRVEVPWHIKERLPRAALPAPAQPPAFSLVRNAIFREIDEELRGTAFDEFNPDRAHLDLIKTEVADLDDARGAGADEYRAQLITVAAHVINAIEEHDAHDAQVVDLDEDTGEEAEPIRYGLVPDLELDTSEASDDSGMDLDEAPL
jgi:hypothetical protein